LASPTRYKNATATDPPGKKGEAVSKKKVTEASEEKKRKDNNTNLLLENRGEGG